MIDTRTWRVGTHYGIHLYAENPGGVDDDPIGTALTREHAEQIVRDHNALYGGGGFWVNPYASMAEERARLLVENLRLRKDIRRLDEMLESTRRLADNSTVRECCCE